MVTTDQRLLCQANFDPERILALPTQGCALVTDGSRVPDIGLDRNTHGAAAISLRGQLISDTEYYVQARRIAERRVPADNNRAERDLRPTIIARKVSFGSQSEAGAKTQGILMTVLVSLKKQHPNDYEQRFKAILDHLAANLSADPYDLLFGP